MPQDRDKAQPPERNPGQKTRCISEGEAHLCLITSRGQDIVLQGICSCSWANAEARKDSELQSRLKRDHAWRAVAAQTDAEQARGRRDGVSKRSEPSLCRRLSWNAGQHHVWQPKIRMVEHIEELTFEPKS